MARIAPFERHVDAYDAWFEHHPDLYQAELKVLGALIAEAGSHGLEVGVGTGKFAVPLKVATGVDPSWRMASRAVDQGVDVVIGVAERLPFASGVFDFVLMVTTICFVDDALAALMEARRVLAPGGILVLGFVDRESPLGRRFLENKARSKFYGEATFYATSEVLNLVERSGFAGMVVKQALIPGEAPGVVRDGFGQGSFVAVRGVRPWARA